LAVFTKEIEATLSALTVLYESIRNGQSALTSDFLHLECHVRKDFGIADEILYF